MLFWTALLQFFFKCCLFWLFILRILSGMFLLEWFFECLSGLFKSECFFRIFICAAYSWILQIIYPNCLLFNISSVIYLFCLFLNSFESLSRLIIRQCFLWSFIWSGFFSDCFFNLLENSVCLFLRFSYLPIQVF